MAASSRLAEFAALSLLNDFFIATDDELAALDVRSGPWPPPPPKPRKKRWWSREEGEQPEVTRSGPLLPVVEAKGVLDVELATLEAILHDERVDDVDAVVALIQDPIRQEPRSSPDAWISPVSNRLASALATAGPDRLARVVEQWIETEEMADSGWTEGEALQLLDDLGQLCRQAREDGRGVYRWFSL